MPATIYGNQVGSCSGGVGRPERFRLVLLRLLVFDTEAVVLVGTSLGERHRIALFVPPDLLPQCCGEVYVQDVDELQKVREDIRNFITDPFRLLRPRHNGSRLLGGEPLEEFDQLADFAGERHDEVLGSVESLPVTLDSELTQFPLKIVQHHAG
jgi:hypothetical protein